uniref:Uncharacterized protein n=1 Tax=Caenorhabditis japonica TaxID=281687 RepID=A0A8R1ILV0_CAEJA
KSFQSTFQRPQSESSTLPTQKASDPRPEWKKKLDEMNAKFAKEHGSSSTSESDSTPSSKKSRWQ